MTLYTNSAEGGSDGTGQTAANSGGASGTALLDPVLNSGTVVYSNTFAAHGSLSYRVTKSSTNACYMVWNPEATTQFAFRGYFYFDALPSAGTGIIQFRASSDLAQRTSVGVSNTGAVFMTSTGSETTVFTSSAGVISADTWYRFESLITISATVGSHQLKIFAGDEPTTTVLDNTISSQNFSTTFSYLRLGYYSAGTTAAAPLYIDDIALESGATSFIGPVSAGSFDGSFVRVAGGSLARVRVPGGDAASIRLAGGSRLEAP